MSSIWITIGPLLFLNLFTIVTLIIFLARREKLPPATDLAGRHQSALLSRTLKEYWYWLSTPPAKLFVRLRISPNILTCIGTILGCFAGFFFAIGMFGVGGWVMILGATFDMFDGRVARLTNASTRSGAFFDSVMDRFSEGFIFLGLAYFFGGNWMSVMCMIAMIGSFVVSYARARGEGVGVMCNKGPMQRGERIAYLGIASVFQPIAHVVLLQWMTAPPPILMIGVVSIIACFTMYTAFYRTVYIMEALDSADRARDAEETIPQLIGRLASKEGREEARHRARYGYVRRQAQYTTCVVFVADGMQSQAMQTQLRRGDLPNISRYLIEPGSFVEATSVFPSTTGLASMPLVTGCFPGTCNVPGLRWFDRTVPPQKRFTLKRFRDYNLGLGAYAIDFDLSKEIKTIFEYSRQAVNILGVINRGSGFRRDPAFLHTPLHLADAKMTDRSEEIERAIFEWFSQAMRKQPDFVYYYFPTISQATRIHGADSPEVKAAYQRFDRYVGDAVELLKSHGVFDHSALVLTGDHAHGEPGKAFDLDGFLERRFSQVIHSTSPSYRGWLEAEAINLISGNGMANIYFRENRSWSQRQHIEGIEHQAVIDALLEQPAVEFIMGRREDGGVVVMSDRGRATIYDKGDLRYEVEKGDPFGYENIPSRLTSQEALRLTAHTAYPDGIVQAAQLFRSRRTGDIVVSAAANHRFADTNSASQQAASHGALHRDHMIVPCAMSVPIAVHPMRTADIFPTILRYVGLAPDHTIDGRAA